MLYTAEVKGEQRPKPPKVSKPQAKKGGKKKLLNMLEKTRKRLQ